MFRFLIILSVFLFSCIVSFAKVNLNGGRINYNQTDSVLVAYVKTHPDDLKSLRMLKGLSITQDYTVIDPLYRMLSARIKNLPAGKKFRKRIESMKYIRIGAEMPDFSLKDTSGHEMTLKQFRGRYVLLDFWASWCASCRKINPELVDIYERFENKHLSILGVSLDKERRFWVAAIKKDKLPWLQVSDLKHWDSVVAQLYGVQAIPQNFLIDPNGKLVSKNLRGKALADKLVELLDSH